MTTEKGPEILDIVTAQLVECAPVPDAPVVEIAVSAPEGTSPTQRAQEATIESTGADPPPSGP